MEYDDLLNEIAESGIELIEDDIPGQLQAFYVDNVIVIDKKLDSRARKCILAEELAHHRLTVGNILDQRLTGNRKQEKKARARAYEDMLPPERLVDAYEAGCANEYEIAEFLEVTQPFLQEAIAHYRDTYGSVEVGSRYAIRFDPLLIRKKR